MSDKKLDLDLLEQQARRRFNVDGLLYVFLGLLLLILGLSFRNPATAWIAAFGAFLILPASALRKRYTYPRIGYAKFEMQPGVGRGILLFALVVMVALFILAFAGGGRFQPYLPIAFGIRDGAVVLLRGVDLRIESARWADCGHVAGQRVRGGLVQRQLAAGYVDSV